MSAVQVNIRFDSTEARRATEIAVAYGYVTIGALCRMLLDCFVQHHQSAGRFVFPLEFKSVDDVAIADVLAELEAASNLHDARERIIKLIHGKPLSFDSEIGHGERRKHGREQTGR